VHSAKRDKYRTTFEDPSFNLDSAAIIPVSSSTSRSAVSNNARLACLLSQSRSARNGWSSTFDQKHISRDVKMMTRTDSGILNFESMIDCAAAELAWHFTGQGLTELNPGRFNNSVNQIASILCWQRVLRRACLPNYGCQYGTLHKKHIDRQSGFEHQNKKKPTMF
jgi:hypothetical protein